MRSRLYALLAIIVNLLLQYATAEDWGYSGFPYGDQLTYSYDAIPSEIASPITDIKAIAASSVHSLALKNDGTLIAWGNGNTGATKLPAGLAGVSAISTSGLMALKEDGTVVAWPNQSTIISALTNIIAIAPNLALKKDGAVINLKTGDIVSGLTNVVSIAASNYHSVALKDNGTVVAWGERGAGQTSVPTGLTNVIAIAAGGYHTLALKDDGHIEAWGLNSDGQISIPSGLTDVTAIAAGDRHTVALMRDGTVRSWGNNSHGQTNVPEGLSGVVAIAAGQSHTLALTNDGTVVGWGYPTMATPPVTPLKNLASIAPGVNHTLAIRMDGTVVAWGRNNEFQTKIPDGLADVKSVAVGHYHSMALKNDGSVMTWGSNNSGQTTLPAGLTNVMAIAAGAGHSLALKEDGTVIAWGSNTHGQSSVPVGLSGIVEIAAGAYHSVALKNDGTVVAWGSIQINNGTLVPIAIPDGLSNVTSIATGSSLAMALKANGTVIAWGTTQEFGGWKQVSVPDDLTGVVAIAAGANNMLALKENGSIFAWGGFWSNTFSESVFPDGLTGVAAIAAGGGTTYYCKSTSKAPKIFQVGNGVIPAINGKQPVTIIGGNFHPDCALTLRDHRTGEVFPNRTKISQTSSRIELNVNFTSTPAEWSAEVINPDGKSSGHFRFQVGATVIPGVTVDQLVVAGSASSMNSGETMPLTATLHYLDGTERDVTDTATFRPVGDFPEGVDLIGNELRTESSTPSTTVSVSASFGTTSGGIASVSNYSVSINRGFSVEIFTVLPENPFTVRATTSLSEIGGSYTYAWDFNGDGIFDDGQNYPWATHTYPTMTGEHTVKVRVTKNTTGELATAERTFRMQKPLAFNQPLSPAPVNVTGLGEFYDKNGAPFEFNYNRIQNGFILLTHGLESSGSAQWLKDLAQNIESAIVDTKGSQFLPNIAIYDWEKDANPYRLDLIFGVGVRDLLAITTAGTTNGGYLANWVTKQKDIGYIDKDAPIHFIGHSAGGFVMGQLAADLNQAGCLVDRVTMLDTPMALPEHLRMLPSRGTYVERLVTSYWGSQNWPSSPRDNGGTYLIEYYPSFFIAGANPLTGERGHGLSYRRYEATATVGNDDYLTPLGVSFWNSPFIVGPRNPQRGNASSPLYDSGVRLMPMEGPVYSPSPPNVEDEQLIENLTSYGTVQQAADEYSLVEIPASDSGASTQIEVPLGAYSVTFRYQFQGGDESDRLVVSAGNGAAQFIVPNLPLYRTQRFEGTLGVAALGQSTITLDFRLDGIGDANSSVTISAIKFLISDDLDQDGVLNAEEVSIGTDPTKPDTDGDGLSDAEEKDVYLTVPTKADTDIDGVPDGMEVFDGTDPNSPQSTFRIIEVAPLDNGDVRISFASVPGRFYRIRGSESPYGHTNWTIRSGIRSSNGIASIIDSGRQNAFQRFYYWVEIEGASINGEMLNVDQAYKLGSYFIPSNVANLSALLVSAGTPGTAFDSNITTYAIAVANGVVSTTVTPTVSHAGATVRVDGTAVASATASASIPLKVGSNLILVEVTAQDGVTKRTYTVTVNRARSTVTTLNSLSLSAGSISPEFEPGTMFYVLSVGNDVVSTTVNPTVTNVGARVKVNGMTVASDTVSPAIPLVVGANTITVEVVAQDGVTKRIYTVMVTRAASPIPKLKRLEIEGAKLTPGFTPGRVNYEMVVGGRLKTVRISAIAQHLTDRIMINGMRVKSGKLSKPIMISKEGTTLVRIVVMANSGAQKTYRLKFVRKK